MTSRGCVGRGGISMVMYAHTLLSLLAAAVLLPYLVTECSAVTIRKSSSEDGLQLPAGNTSVIRSIAANSLLSSRVGRTTGYPVFIRAFVLDNRNQSMWSFENETGFLRSVAYDRCLDTDVRGLSPNLQICDTEKETQQWELETSDNYTYQRIRNLQNSLYLDQQDLNTSASPVMSELNASSDSQLWIFLPAQKRALTGRGRIQHAWPDHPENQTLVWPNSNSSANTDSYLRLHHNAISQLRPKVLVISPMVEFDVDDILARAQNTAIGLDEGSRYHGYMNPEAPMFLRYIIDRVVVVNSDSSPSYSLTWEKITDPYYPRVFFEAAFANVMGYESKTSDRNLTMCELFQEGIINEVWLAGWPAEFLSYAPRYSSQLVRSNFDRCAGNGCLTNASAVAYCNTTVRMAGLTMDRRLGCDLHNQGHGIEHLSRINTYWNHQAQRFWLSDLRRLHGAPFDSLYQLPDFNASCPAVLNYTNSSAVNVTYSKSSNGSIIRNSSLCGNAHFVLHDVWKGCANTHYSPNSRFVYDADQYKLVNSSYYGPPAPSVSNACENYGMQNGANGQDLVTEYSYFSSKASYYDALGFDDCEGGWNIYMRQNIPGFQNKAIQDVPDLDEPYMRNWWPFLFY